jgi:hypothetical protein
MSLWKYIRLANLRYLVSIHLSDVPGLAMLESSRMNTQIFNGNDNSHNVGRISINSMFAGFSRTACGYLEKLEKNSF